MRVLFNPHKAPPFQERADSRGPRARAGVEDEAARRDEAGEEAHDGGGFSGHVVLVAGADGFGDEAGEDANAAAGGERAFAAPDDEFALFAELAEYGAGALAFVPGDDAAGDEAGHLDGELQRAELAVVDEQAEDGAGA